MAGLFAILFTIVSLIFHLVCNRPVCYCIFGCIKTTYAQQGAGAHSRRSPCDGLKDLAFHTTERDGGATVRSPDRCGGAKSHTATQGGLGGQAVEYSHSGRVGGLKDGTRCAVLDRPSACRAHRCVAQMCEAPQQRACGLLHRTESCCGVLVATHAATMFAPQQTHKRQSCSLFAVHNCAYIPHKRHYRHTKLTLLLWSSRLCLLHRVMADEAFAE